MLAPDSRTVAFELLRPPAGYDLDFALLTTYTLDLEALLALPLSVISRAEKNVEDLLADPLLLLEALRQAGERIHCFVDRTGIAIPRTSRELYAMLEPSVHPVRAPEDGGAFHSKVWVARFTAGNVASLLRVAVLSRNLTFDRSWDVALASEASPKPRRRSAASRPLSEFIHALPDLAVERLQPDISRQISDLADEVSRTIFPAPEGFFTPIEFHVLGLHRQRGPWCPAPAGSRTMAIAPFVNHTGLDSIVRTAESERILVSRQEELDKLHDDALAGWDSVCTLSDAALDEPEDGTADHPTGLHAKIVAVEHGWDVTWYVGSANLTAAALTGRNVEVMAAISARKGRRNGNSGYGIDRFFQSGFEQLCTPYRRCGVATIDPEVDEALKRLEEVRDSLLDADDLKVICSPAGDDWEWRLEGSPALPSDSVEVTAWPISISEDNALALTLPLTWTLPIQRLTSLVAFRLHVPVKAVDDISLALRLPVEGMPEDRMHHVLMSLISDRQRFLAFLRALLGGLEGMVDWALDQTGENDGVLWGVGLSEDSILEDLVHTASRDPARLEPVRRLIDDFRKTEQGRSIVPDDFYNLWTAVDEALDESMDT